MSELFQMQTDLVLPAGVKTQFEQGRAVQALFHAIVRRRLQSRILIVHQLAPAIAVSG